jgi:hypothetical protein
MELPWQNTWYAMVAQQEVGTQKGTQQVGTTPGYRGTGEGPSACSLGRKVEHVYMKVVHRQTHSLATGAVG